MAMDRTPERPDGPAMICAECGRTARLNPTGFCCWACYEARPRDPESGEAAMAFLLRLGPPDSHHHRNP